MLKIEYIWFKENTQDHVKKITFWCWEIAIIAILSYIWKYITIALIIFYVLNFMLLLTNRMNIKIKTKKKIQTHIAYLRINFILSIGKSHFKKENVTYILFSFFFRNIIGFGYRVIKMSINMYNTFEKEYTWANIKQKKKSPKIIKQFLSRALEHFVFIEFIKHQPIIEKTMSVNVGKKKKEFKITIIS